MRLINTLTLELEEFMGAAPPYAILSHTWADGEVTLQDWQKVRQSERWRSTTAGGGGRSVVNGAVTAAAPKKNSIASLYRPQPQQPQQQPQYNYGQPQYLPQQQLPIYYTPPTDHSTFEEALSAFNEVEPRAGYWKILKACFQARADGLAYVWVDTNCIDKTSSAELSEAINSMYAWYRDAALCYVYLVDVPLSPQDTLRAPGSSFRASRWFTRGWTLQELIAPPEAVFFSGEWTRLGSKTSLSDLLADITSIGEQYLLKMEGIDGASIAQRMSWASNRTTTRPEDIAYCLLGLFSVHMPLIYGEGAKAFVRLQEEIIKISDDHSIFAWTWVPQLTDPVMRGQRTGGGGWRPSVFSISPPSVSPPTAPHDYHHHHRRESNSTSSVTGGGGVGGGSSDEKNKNEIPRFPHARLQSLRESGGTWSNPKRPTMLAPDPACFYDSGHFRVLVPRPDVSPFSITNAGLSIKLPLLPQGTAERDSDQLELYLAVLDVRIQLKTSERVLVCVPLAAHGRFSHRYTRTCFPRGPVTVCQRAGDGDGSNVIPESWASWTLLTPTKDIQVARDVQRVPFYYSAFGGTDHELGFWFFTPQGWSNRHIVGGFAIPSVDGVFNGHGIFFNRPATEGETVGGLVVLQLSKKKLVAIYLAYVAGQSAPVHRVKVLVRNSPPPAVLSGTTTAVAVAAAPSSRRPSNADDNNNNNNNNNKDNDSISIHGDTWTGGTLDTTGCEKLFEALRLDDERAAAAAGLENVTEASAGSVRVRLHNQAALSNAPRSSVTLTEITLLEPSYSDAPGPAGRKMGGLFRGVRTI